MNTRQAIIAAANQIDRTPAIFAYFNSRVPSCGSPGCFIGLIACNAGFPHGESVHELCPALFGVSWDVVYDRVFDLSGRALVKNHSVAWCSDPALTARTMRLYADKYHPAPAPIPASVRAIFEMTPAELAREFA